MFGVNELIKSFRLNIALTEKQKEKILRSSLKDKTVIDYLKDRLSNLTIKINNDDEYPFFELMKKKGLLGICYQTSETIAALLNDDDYIERGCITRGGLADTHGLDHSWVCFKYNDVEYVLDASLNILCTRDDYYAAFTPMRYAKVDALSIKEELIRQLTLPREIDDSRYNEKGLLYDIGMWDDGATSLIIKSKEEVDIDGSNDKNSPLYGNHASYIADIEDGKIKKLLFHIYKKPC